MKHLAKILLQNKSKSLREKTGQIVKTSHYRENYLSFRSQIKYSFVDWYITNKIEPEFIIKIIRLAQLNQIN
jgi:hypothetical protein